MTPTKPARIQTQRRSEGCSFRKTMARMVAISGAEKVIA